MTKKLFYFVIAAALICGASVFTSCTNDDNPIAEPDLGVADKIIGNWMMADQDGQAMPTNEKIYFTFVSATKAYRSASLNAHPELGTLWSDKIEADVTIDGNKMTITNHPDEQRTVVEVYTITAISGTEFTANRKLTVTVDGTVTVSKEDTFRFIKVTADCTSAILGTWEGQATSDEDTYGDGKQHRWEYKADGTFVYYVKDGDDWVPSTNTLNEYFVAGNLLCTRWIDNEIEYREWWEIESIENGVMKWKALRQKEDGTTFTSTFEMKKVTE